MPFGALKQDGRQQGSLDLGVEKKPMPFGALKRLKRTWGMRQLPPRRKETNALRGTETIPGQGSKAPQFLNIPGSKAPNALRGTETR
jgi:hypothetical protein